VLATRYNFYLNGKLNLSPNREYLSGNFRNSYDLTDNGSNESIDSTFIIDAQTGDVV